MSGLLGHVAIAKQNSFGTASTSFGYTEVLNESLSTEVEALISEGLVGRFAEGRTTEGYETIAGDISMEVDPIRIGDFIRSSFGQVTTTNITSTAGFKDYQHVFTPLVNTKFDSTLCDIPPYTLQIYRDSNEAFLYTDSVVNKIEFTVEAGGLLQCTAGMLARTTSLSTVAGPSFTEMQPFSWAVMSASLGGTGITDYESLTFSFENAVEGVKLLNTSKRVAKFKRTGMQLVRISGTLDFSTNSEYVRFKNQAETQFIMNMGSMISSGPFMKVDIPNLRYASLSPQLGGTGRISVDFEAHGKFDVTSNYAIEITLTNTQATY